jgi:hypothetical protein
MPFRPEIKRSPEAKISKIRERAYTRCNIVSYLLRTGKGFVGATALQLPDYVRIGYYDGVKPRRYWIAGCFATALMMMLGLAANGQQPPNAFLVDEFGPLSCEEILSKTDILADELNREPSADAFIVINPLKNDTVGAKKRLRLITSALRINRIDSSRFSFWIGEELISIDTQFWLVPNGAKPPDELGQKWTEPDLETSKSFIYGYADEVDACPVFRPSEYAALLKQDRTAKGHIVVYGPKERQRIQFARRWLETFEKDFGLGRDRFRVMYIENEGTLTAEFWFATTPPR